MRKSEMSEKQIELRTLFVTSLTRAGWRALNFNQDFDQGLKTSPEASMKYSNGQITLRFDLVFEDPRAILYLDSKEGKSLGLVFKCEDRLPQLLAALVGMQDSIAPDNIKKKSEDLVAACPNTFKISASGDKLLPVKPKKAG